MKKINWGSLLAGVILVLVFQWFMSRRKATA
jgi:hypothetical protein